jgi:hypothetical protein
VAVCKPRYLQEMRGGPTVTNSSLWLPGGRGLTPVEKDLLLKAPRLVKVAKRIKVGRDTLRVRALDLKRKGSDQRHFKAQFHRMFQSHAGDPNPAEGMEMRYAELMGIYEVTVGRKEPIVLLKGRWFPHAAQSFHKPSRNMVLETGRAWDPVEPMVEARKIVGMVVLAPFPVMPGIAVAPRSVVLDKLLDTMAEVSDDEA